MQIADLELIIANVTTVEVLEATYFEECPFPISFSQKIKYVPITFVLSLPLAQHDFENDLITLFLDVVNDTQCMLVSQVRAITDENHHEIVLSNLW